jgi:hypothetical protein
VRSTFHVHDQLAFLEAGLQRRRMRRRRRQQGLLALDADDEGGPVEADRQQEVERRPRQDDQAALPQRRVVEGARALVRQHRALALVEHAHVAAQRHRRDHVLDAVGAAPSPQRPAEADREAQHLHAAAPRDPEMAELVERHQHADGDDEAADAPRQVKH